MTTPREILDLAVQLSKSSQAAERRAAVNRAYYAAFHALHDVLEPLCSDADFGENRALKHGAVVAKLRRWQEIHPDQRLAMQFGAEATTLYHKLVNLKESREVADYDLAKASDVGPRDSIALVARAENVLSFVAKIERASCRTA